MRAKTLVLCTLATGALGTAAGSQPSSNSSIDLSAPPASKMKPAAPPGKPLAPSRLAAESKKEAAGQDNAVDQGTELFTPIPTGKPTALAMRGLDKITGRPTDIIAPMNTPVNFATLTITARTCYSTPPTEPPETTAFVQIVDHRPDQPAHQIFSGWMFSSTPSLNGMQHPLYDVWVINCKMNQPGVVASVAPVKAPAKAVSPNAGADEQLPELPEGAGQ